MGDVHRRHLDENLLNSVVCDKTTVLVSLRGSKRCKAVSDSIEIREISWLIRR